MKDTAYLTNEELIEDFKDLFLIMAGELTDNYQGKQNIAAYWQNQEKIWERIKDLFREIQKRGL